jgi:hypothetical protein
MTIQYIEYRELVHLVSTANNNVNERAKRNGVITDLDTRQGSLQISRMGLLNSRMGLHGPMVGLTSPGWAWTAQG